jgi:hypothetical protein
MDKNGVIPGAGPGSIVKIQKQYGWIPYLRRVLSQAACPEWRRFYGSSFFCSGPKFDHGRSPEISRRLLSLYPDLSI